MTAKMLVGGRRVTMEHTSSGTMDKKQVNRGGQVGGRMKEEETATTVVFTCVLHGLYRENNRKGGPGASI
jgi:hypothetical protein